MRVPVAAFPEAIALHLPAAVAERRVAVRSALQVEIPQVLQIGPNYLRRERENAVKYLTPLHPLQTPTFSQVACV